MKALSGETTHYCLVVHNNFCLAIVYMYTSGVRGGGVFSEITKVGRGCSGESR